MEDLDQAYGYILYTTKLPGNGSGKLEIHDVHDFAAVYVDHQPIGTLDRRLGQGALMLPPGRGGQELEILVENTGRVNYTKVMRGERKGITSRVVLSGVDLHGWNIYSLPMQDTTELQYKVGVCFGPCFYKSTIAVGRTSTVPLDTYVNTTSINKGMIWVNQRPLGRFWFIGPQGVLYLPGSWLHSGANELTCFDLESAGSDSIATVAHPIFFLPIPAANIDR